LHRSRFIKPGDYVSLEVAGFPILLILGQDNIVRAFHNVCRHRAYTITKKAAGSSLVLGCRYHGWSYNSKGDLLKVLSLPMPTLRNSALKFHHQAPHFDGVEGFNKSDNSLFKIHTCIDRSGFIHINLDAGPLRHAPDCEVLGGFAAKHGISVSSKWITGWETDRDFNWKTVGM
jgi:phenylpropionate dioxygenase-like ring-hydroxylating dioxygenase large terminal subunit